MKYYKRDGVVIKSNDPVLSLEDSSILGVFNGKIALLTSLPTGGMNSHLDGIIINEAVTWEEATELEYRTYVARLSNVDSLLDRDTQARLWALNNANHTELRLGLKYPEDGGKISIEALSDKISILSKTQHWHDSSRPSVQNRKNSVWVDWIIKMRSSEDFIYIAEVNPLVYMGDDE